MHECRKVVIITGPKSYQATGHLLEASLQKAGVRFEVVVYSGENSDEEASRIVSLASKDRNLVIGLGGGKRKDNGLRKTGGRTNELTLCDRANRSV